MGRLGQSTGPRPPERVLHQPRRAAGVDNRGALPGELVPMEVCMAVDPAGNVPGDSHADDHLRPRGAPGGSASDSARRPGPFQRLAGDPDAPPAPPHRPALHGRDQRRHFDRRAGAGAQTQESCLVTRMQATTLVVIVNYRTADLVVDCLRSLEPEVAAVERAFGPVKVVVVDNASGDGSPERIEAAIASHGWAPWAELRRLPRNGGFAWGNNAAIRSSTQSEQPPGFVWLLNPDTVVRPGALAHLLEFMQANPSAGLAGSRLEDPDGTVQRSAFRFPSVASEIDNGLRLGIATRLLSHRVIAPEPPGRATRSDWLSGASLLIRWEVIRDIGLMDEGFFMYFEETDFCRRA